MGELSIRRNRAFSVPQYTPPTKAEKAASAASSPQELAQKVDARADGKL